jgi:hypothetical protein
LTGEDLRDIIFYPGSRRPRLRAETPEHFGVQARAMTVGLHSISNDRVYPFLRQWFSFVKQKKQTTLEKVFAFFCVLSIHPFGKPRKGLAVWQRTF